MTQTWRRRICHAILVFILTAAPAAAQEKADRSLSPYFLIEGGEASVEAFPLKSTRVEAAISGVIADVFVTQTYANEGSLPIHARYVFPGSTRASVHGMKFRIGDELVVAKIREREQAKQEFETAKAQGKSASLLEQHRPNVFTMNVANILPGDQVEVELHYTELLVPEEGIYQFVYPTVVGPRYSHQTEATAPDEDRWVKSPYLHEGKAPPSKFDIRVTLSAGLPLGGVHSSSHAVNVDWRGQAEAEITLADAADSGGNRDFILEYRLAGREIQSGLLLYEGKEENFFLLMVEPPERVQPADIPPREYIFVLDVSGSMEGFPLDTAKSLIRDLIAHLRPTDLFDVVLFSGGSRVMAPTSVPATGPNALRAIRMIEEERGGGGTELVPALTTALGVPRDEKFSRTIVVITDGFINAEEEVFEVIRSSLDRTNFFSFGIGTGVNRYLVEGMAKAGQGEPFVVTGPGEAAAAASRFREYIESPVLMNLKVTASGFDVTDVEPPALPDLFARRPVVLFGKWRGSRAGEIVVTGSGGAGRYERRFRVSETRPSAENGALRYLWARAKVARLADFSFGREEAAAAAEITSLGLNYSLLTRHTSFVAVIEKVRNTVPGAKEVDQPLPLPLGVGDGAVGGDFAAGPEPELWVLLVVVGLGIALSAKRRRRASALR